MGSLRPGRLAWLAVIISLFYFLPACGGHKPAGASPYPVRISLTPASSYSVQAGTTFQFFASAQNNTNGTLSTTFAYASTDSGILDVAPNGLACAGTWNAPQFNECTPSNGGVVQVTASALGATSAPTLVFVHPPIDNIQISVVPPVNAPPPACPNQGVLPTACNLKFNASASNYCMSQNQLQTLQATAYSKGGDITSSVGPFTWTESNSAVKITPIVTNSTYNVPTNQVTVSPSTPGQGQVIASAANAFSQPYNVETCPVQCIAMELGVSGSQSSNSTSFVLPKGTSEIITATAVDVQGCIVPKPALTWTSSAPAALTAGSATAGCAAGMTCTVATTQPGTAAITASCTPPTCNVGFPLNPAGLPAPYIPQPVYPVTAISGLVTGAPASALVLATSQDCATDVTCSVAMYDVLTTSNQSGGGFQIPTPPNSLLFDPPGDRAYMGSEFGALVVTPSNFGSSSASPFASITAASTPLGLVTGKVLAISPNGTFAVFADNVSTPNQVYVTSTATTSPSSTALNISSAIAAAFSPDGLKVFILGDGGNTLYVYSQMQSLLPPIKLPAPASAIVFNSTGSFALLAGGSSPSTDLAIYSTCDNSSVTLTPSPGLQTPPKFLKMVPTGDIPQGNPPGNLFGGILIPNLEPAGLDFFFGLDNTGIDIIATNSAPADITTLCSQKVTLPLPLATTFAPVHIDIGQGTFHPIDFFLSPDATLAYIVTSDLGVLVYNFNTNSTSKIALTNNATPLAADITIDGTMIYVAGSDGELHALNTAFLIDQTEILFPLLPNSTSNFCYTGNNCAPNLVAVKP
jgi:hypothetical protein